MWENLYNCFVKITAIVLALYIPIRHEMKSFFQTNMVLDALFIIGLIYLAKTMLGAHIYFEKRKEKREPYEDFIIKY